MQFLITKLSKNERDLKITQFLALDRGKGLEISDTFCDEHIFLGDIKSTATFFP